MNKIILYIFIVFSAKAMAQNNQLLQNAKWHASRYAKYSGSSCYWRRDYNQYFNGDTLINGNQYYKLFETGTHLDQPGGQQGICPNLYYSYTQNSSILVRYDQKKLLIWSSTNNQEEVFLDYNLHVGDTITNVGFSKPYGMNLKIPVTSIDSVLVNGTYLKRFYYEGAMGSKYVIERIGSIQGFLETYSYDFESGSNLTCYSENQITLYNEPSSSNSCDITLVLNETNFKQENISIFPNPASDELKVITKNGEQIIKVQIKNYLGQLITTFNQPDSLYSYDISSLKSGIYLIIIETSIGNVSKKIVKQ
jgi:hypothetical protein